MSAVSKVLNSLAGVYRDTIRVSGDANKLLNNQNGKYLRPNQSSLMENNGNFHTKLLVLQGTIPVIFQGSKYNIPLDIFLPPNYPVRPPICFLRPTESMMIKENHKHVGRDGMVYLPYLHSWRMGSHNLIMMVHAMQKTFGSDPPLFSKPKASVATPSYKASTKPNRPEFNDIQAAIDQSKRDEEERRRQEQIERQKIEDAKYESMLAAQEEQSANEAKVNLTKKLRENLHSFYSVEKDMILNEIKKQRRLESGQEIISAQLKELNERKSSMLKANEQVEETICELKEWVDNMQMKEEEIKEKEDIDSMVQPSDNISKQMIDLSSENASISDCLYFLDRALVKGKIPLDVHLKKVRFLAKKQFFARAHLIKIADIRAKN